MAWLLCSLAVRHIQQSETQVQASTFCLFLFLQWFLALQMKIDNIFQLGDFNESTVRIVVQYLIEACCIYVLNVYGK